jgi:hypothetical protein
VRGVAILLAGTAMVLGAPSAWAQNNSSTPAIITLPGIDRFSLPPSGQQPTPLPTPTPLATPTPSAPPPVTTTRERPTPAPTRSARPAPPLVAAATPTPSPTPTPATTPEAAPVALVTPTPLPTPTPAPLPAPADTHPPDHRYWPWLLGGVGLLALAAGYYWGRRRRPADRVAEVEVAPAPVVAPTPPVTARPVPPPPAATPPPEPPPAAPLAIELVATGVAVAGGAITLDFALVVGNPGPDSADGLRVALAIVAAGPALNDHIAGFNAGAAGGSSSDPVTLAPGEGHRIAGRLTLPPEVMHVTQVGGRPMAVPVVLVQVRWRGGLSVRRYSEAFLVGTGDAAASRLGPIWLDRANRQFTSVAARRFDPA